MVKNSQSGFYVEVWQYVEPKVKVLQLINPGDKTQTQADKAMKKMKEELESPVRECRNFTFNLAQLVDPGAAAIPEDVLEMTKVKKSAYFYFYDKATKCPQAPTVWPRGRNVPVAVFGTDSKNLLKGPFIIMGIARWLLASFMLLPRLSKILRGRTRCKGLRNFVSMRWQILHW